MKKIKKMEKESMLALSWKQPFGIAMLHGKIETRTWNTKYRGLVLICASRIPYSKNQIIEITGAHQFNRLNEVCNGLTSKVGNAIAVGRLVDCRKMARQKRAIFFGKFTTT